MTARGSSPTLPPRTSKSTWPSSWTSASSPARVINSPITDGAGIIEGSFTIESAKALVVVLKYGALPVALEVLENRTVGPTLGQDSVQKSFVAGAVGLLIVVFFMLVYYRLPGLLADMALVIYALITFALFKLIPVTLTLPGIAGFILSIGMAVDANILIFERMKEELRAGKTLGAAIEAGFARAWTCIRDSNASTLITCAILFWFGMNFGASIIKGFALTLAIGVLVSLFTAITVSRTFLRLMVNTEYAKNLWLFGITPRSPPPTTRTSMHPRPADRTSLPWTRSRLNADASGAAIVRCGFANARC